MLSNAFFSHRKFRPGSVALSQTSSRFDEKEKEKLSRASTLPYGNRMRHHLAIDTDPTTPCLKRFTNYNSVETRLQLTLYENVLPNKSTPTRALYRKDGSIDASISSSTTLSSSNSPISRPNSWINDGNWTLKKIAIDSGSDFGFSDGGADRSTITTIDSPRQSSKDSETNSGEQRPLSPCITPPILTLSDYAFVENQNNHQDDTCCHCSKNDNRCRSRTNSHGTVIEEETVSENETSKIDIDPIDQSEIDRSAIDRSIIVDRSASSCSSLASGINEKRISDHYKSCPDLIRPCLLSVESVPDSFLSPTYGTLGVTRRKKSRNNRRTNTPVTPEETFLDSNQKFVGGIFEKSLRKWTLDDILVWLEKIGLDQVASILVGYELSGSDLEMWDEHILTSYGISDLDTRASLLRAVHDLKIVQQNQNRISISSIDSSRTLARKWSRGSGSNLRNGSQYFSTLYDVIKRSGHDQIVAIDLPDDLQPFRAFTVARQAENGLVISGCRNAHIPLVIGDIVLEFNGENCLPLAAVDFHVLTSQSNTKQNKIVVLRKCERGASTSSSEDRSRNTIQCSPVPPVSSEQQNDDEEVFFTRL